MTLADAASLYVNVRMCDQVLMRETDISCCIATSSRGGAEMNINEAILGRRAVLEYTGEAVCRASSQLGQNA